LCRFPTWRGGCLLCSRTCRATGRSLRGGGCLPWCSGLLLRSRFPTRRGGCLLCSRACRATGRSLRGGGLLCRFSTWRGGCLLCSRTCRATGRSLRGGGLLCRFSPWRGCLSLRNLNSSLTHFSGHMFAGRNPTRHPCNECLRICLICWVLQHLLRSVACCLRHTFCVCKLRCHLLREFCSRWRCFGLKRLLHRVVDYTTFACSCWTIPHCLCDR